ncbi:MAG: formylglycine-generating enzyme family protein [Alphaproteobacteria bacterium]|nr:formylglycine-generating enzyme family protein [Alphaproteobacteria bacterium]
MLAAATLVVVAFAPVRAPVAEPPVPATVAVPAGPFVYGSDRAERESAYLLDEAAYGHRVTRERKWYENEPLGTADTGAYRITETPVTNAQYAAFVRDTGHNWPNVDADTWRGYRLIHPYERTRRHAWTGPAPPPGRADHPVVMVSHADAVAFADWLSAKTGMQWRLPTEAEWEKAARGTDGRYFPWGNTFEPDRLNSHDLGPFDTMPVGSFPAGVSPYGVLDSAGQVYEWTATPKGDRRYIVKGGSWDDKGCGVCRPAGRHSRPTDIKHILVGFRLVLDAGHSAQ